MWATFLAFGTALSSIRFATAANTAILFARDGSLSPNLSIVSLLPVTHPTSEPSVSVPRLALASLRVLIISTAWSILPVSSPRSK